MSSPSCSCSLCSPALPVMAQPGQMDPACGCCPDFVASSGAGWPLGPLLPSPGRLLGREALGSRGGASAARPASGTCRRGQGNDSTGEGLGFKNNRLGGCVASWPSCAALESRPAPALAGLSPHAWELSHGQQHGSSSGGGPCLGSDACVPPSLCSSEADCTLR